MTAQQLRDTTIEVLNEQVETDFKEELMCLFSAAKLGKFNYVFDNGDFTRSTDEFYSYLARGGFSFHIRKFPNYGYTASYSLLEITDADKVKVSWGEVID